MSRSVHTKQLLRIKCLNLYGTIDPVYPRMGPYQCDNSRGKGGIKLACGRMLPIVAGTLIQLDNKNLTRN